MQLLCTYVLTGILVGGVYGLIALGVVGIYKATKVFNFAVGEMLTIGGCVGISLMSAGIPPALGVILTFALTAIFGWLVNRAFMVRFIGQPVLIAWIATAVLIEFLSGVGVSGWGGQPMSFPRFLPSGGISFGGVFLAWELVFSFIAALILFGLFSWIFQYTKLGLGVRAAAEDLPAAESKGIGAKRVQDIAWIIGGVTAAVGGILFGYRAGVTPTASLLGLRAFPVVFLGGLESIPGALVGGVIIGVVETLAGGYMGTEWMAMIPFIILLLMLIIRPQGIFGLKLVERI